ncbi:aminotransferase class V-fold PLP-dependent enzyme [Pandoraea anhela]|uniref:L-seryl-tRNA(Sec) selenium transferase n=1 Tax=Pandoraea anhela TaxID=2508295 RepID=A0A5E4W914_9BURK|nr:PLP-dependent transferase [Pandoraea anhela]VVE21212.1 L-seryl-tRNA(Sec) selenium transferase [Pandoraea anhela]
MSAIFEQLNIRRVVNASGTETPYGAAPVRSEVIRAISDLVPYSVIMAELQATASQVISRILGSEAGCVTGCSAAGITVAVAACMTGRDLGKVEQLPDTTGMKCEVVMQRGHEMTYGQNVSQNVRIAGAKVVEIGAATQCGAYQLRHAITENTVAALYVVSPLTVQQRLIDLPTFCAVCHEHGVPVLVDAASVQDPRPLIAAGADIVICSAQKTFSSITGGILAGRLDLIQACMYQEHGIGRPMKVGKEGVVGAIAALEAWSRDDPAAHRSAVTARLNRVMDRLKAIPGLSPSVQKDQVLLRVNESEAGVSAYGLARSLFDHDPAVIVWSQFASEGQLLITLRKLSDDAADYVCDRIEEICATGEATKLAAPNIGDAIVARLAEWPYFV